MHPTSQSTAQAGTQPKHLVQLEQFVDEIAALHSKLILLIGPPGSGKTRLLKALGLSTQTVPLNLGSALGRQLAAIPQKQRHLQAGTLLRELAGQHANGDILLIDNIELLFDTSLQLNPLDLLKRNANTKRVVAVWPGELRGDGNMARLTYADLGHTEQRSYGLDGWVPLHLQP